MMSRGLLVVVCFMLMGGGSAASDIRVELDWSSAEPVTVAAYSVDVSAEGVETRIPLTGVEADDGWRFSFEPEEGRLITELAIELGGEMPDGFVFEPLRVRAPFYKSAFGVHATPARVDTSEAATVVRLFETNPRGQSERDLFKMYQETWAVARARMATSGDIDVRDVRAVYKFLETAYVMTEETHVFLAPDVAKGYAWLAEARKGYPVVVAEALEGFDEEASRILLDVSQLESIPYKRLWNEIKAVPCTQSKIAMIEEFYLSLIRKLDRDRRKRIVDTIGVNRVTAENDANQCARTLVIDDAVEREAKLSILSRRLEHSEAALSEYKRDSPDRVQLQEGYDYLLTVVGEIELGSWFSAQGAGPSFPGAPSGPRACCRLRKQSPGATGSLVKRALPPRPASGYRSAPPGLDGRSRPPAEANVVATSTRARFSPGRLKDARGLGHLHRPG